MKITGDRGSIWVEINNKVVKISGELTTTPAFYADINSIKNWEPPFQDIAITEEEKAEIIRRATEESQKEGHVKIYFD